MSEDIQMNGAGSDPADEAIRQITQLREQARGRVVVLENELAQQTTVLKRYDKALKALRGEALGNPGRKPGPKPSAGTARARGIGEGQLEAVKEAILRFDHEEFRQVDIRTMPNTPTSKSSQMALAFETLRQEGWLRFARKDGNNKFYRLTNSAVRDRAEA